MFLHVICSVVIVLMYFLILFSILENRPILINGYSHNLVWYLSFVLFSLFSLFATHLITINDFDLKQEELTSLQKKLISFGYAQYNPTSGDFELK